MRSSAAVSSTRRRRSLRGTPWHFRGKAMLSWTFICGYSAKSWNMNATSRRDARRGVTSSPSIRICPEVGSSRPAIIRRVVVLPHPEGPSITKNSPPWMVNEDSRTATNSPKRFCRFRTPISAIASLRKVAHDERSPPSR